MGSKKGVVFALASVLMTSLIGSSINLQYATANHTTDSHCFDWSPRSAIAFSNLELGIPPGTSQFTLYFFVLFDDFEGDVFFNASGVPSGVTVNFNPMSLHVPGGSSFTETPIGMNILTVPSFSGSFDLTLTIDSSNGESTLTHCEFRNISEIVHVTVKGAVEEAPPTEPSPSIVDKVSKIPCSSLLNPITREHGLSEELIRKSQTNPDVGKYGKVRDEGKTGHWGVDILANKDKPVYAVADGEVVLAGWENKNKHTQGFGLRVWIKHIDNDGKTYFTVYGHLSEIRKEILDASEKQEKFPVKAGDVIGKVGTTGNAKGLPLDETHLHFGMHKAIGVESEENSVNPIECLRTKSLAEKNVSVVMKQKKRTTLVAVKNNGEEEIFGLQIKIDNGKISYVKAGEWERDRIDQSTVILQTSDRPIKLGKSFILILIVDNRSSSFEWTAFDVRSNIVSKGDVIPKS